MTFLVVGPESSGTRYMASVLDCCGVSVRRWSLPHGGKWPDIAGLVSGVDRVIVTVRNEAFMAQSQVRAGHVGSLVQARTQIQSAWARLFAGLSGIRQPVHVFPYESWVHGTGFLADWELVLLREPEPWVDGNRKYL